MEHLDLIEQFPPDLRSPIIALVKRLREDAGESATREDYFRLEGKVGEQSAQITRLVAAQTRADERIEKLVMVVADLAEAQVRTALGLENLARAQARTEENLSVLGKRMDQLTERVDRLAERMDQLAVRMDQLTERVDQLTVRMDQLTERVDRLAERMDQLTVRMDQLTERVDLLTVRMDRLAERMEQLTGEVVALKHGLRETRKDVGALMHNWGHSLEDKAMNALPPLLLRDHGISVLGRLRRDHLELSPGHYVEINIWGNGTKNGKPVEIIGEAKSRLNCGHVDKFSARVEMIAKHLGREVAPVMIAFLTAPGARRYAEDRGVIFYASYEI
jgi:predicted nuclease with TOPRIM domain